jgi:hypothetical protein
MGRSLITVVMPDSDLVITDSRDKGPEGSHGVGGGCAVLNGSGEVATDVYGPLG